MSVEARADLDSVMKWEFLPFLSSPYSELQAKLFPFQKQRSDTLAMKTVYLSSSLLSVPLFQQKAVLIARRSGMQQGLSFCMRRISALVQWKNAKFGCV